MAPAEEWQESRQQKMLEQWRELTKQVKENGIEKDTLIQQLKDIYKEADND